MPRPELASWMTPVDRNILERLRNEGNDELVLTPALISDNSDWGRNAVRKHLMTLREQGLVEYYDEERAVYRLSERGRAWLEGDLPTEDLEDED
jgi:predicted ArsR family transcriptional regulator